MLHDYLTRILTARVYDVAIETPLDPAPLLSARLGSQVYLKREDLQPVFSFKIRGAFNKISRLSEACLAGGVIAASAGNHAQGVALAAQTFGIRAVIVMPVRTPEIKVDAVAKRGAEVILHGESYNDAYEHAVTLAASMGLTFIHPYDDPDVIAGQGTIAVEILRQHTQPIDAIFVCVGGGGLIAGIAAYVKSLYPSTRIIGVEPTESPTLHAALAAGEPVWLDQVGAFADGVAVKRIGDETFRVCRELVDEVILVDNDAICAAIKDVFQDTRSILEPAGALGVAGMKEYVAREGSTGATYVAICSGANMNFDRLRYVAERAEIGEEREALLAVTIPERPGSFKRFCTLLGDRAVTEFNYRYADPAEAHVFVGVSIRRAAERALLVQNLNDAGLAAVDLSTNEVAKLHIRHMVGGRNPELADERLLLFEFPERPGALMRFLNQMAPNWNITLFHYRNQGGDVGRVLVGLQVPQRDAAAFDVFIRDLQYPCEDVSADPACRLFL